MRRIAALPANRRVLMNRVPSRVVGALLVAVLSGTAGMAARPGAAAVAQERPSGPTVDFTVISSVGVPLTDVVATELEIKIDGRRRTVRQLRAVSVAPSRTGSPAPVLPPPYGTNSASNTGRTVLLVIDGDSFLAGREQPLRNAVDGLLGQLIRTDRVMLVQVPYGGAKLPLTTEHARLRSAVAAFVGQRPRDETGSAMSCRTRLVLEAIGTSLEVFRGSPAPVEVVLFTAGLAAPRRDAPMARGPGMCELQPADFQRVTAAAGAARANFFIVHPDDLPGSVGARTEGIAGTGFTGSDNPLEGIEHLAGATAAQRLPLAAAGTAALDRVARETSVHYLAELEPERSDSDNRSKSLNVRLERQGVTVRARPEITFPLPSRRPAAPPLSASEMLLKAEGFPDLPVRAAAFTMEASPDGRLRIVVVADVLDVSIPIAQAAAALVDTGDRVVARWSAPEAGVSPLVGAMLVPPGNYRLRVAVVDAEGRTGAADYDFEARLIPVGPLSLGSIVMGLSREGSLTPRLEFTNEPSALASFEISGGAAGTPLSAVLEVARTPDGPPIIAVPLAITSTGGQRFLAMGTVVIGALPPGDYAVRGIIRLGDGAMGRVEATLRKR